MAVSPLPTTLYCAAQVRAMDACAINDYQIAGAILMKRAGRVCFNSLVTRFPSPGTITVVCGGGNNGGDGYVVAALARQANIPVQVFYLADPSSLKGDAKRAYDYAVSEQVPITPWTAEVEIASGIVVDAMLGTGLAGEVRGDYCQAIKNINDSGQPVLSVDIPSGLHADTGAVLGVAIQATVTCSFIGLKVGLVTAEGPQLVGELVFDDLQVPDAVFSIKPLAERLSLATLLARLPARKKSAHKGSFGHALIMGGSVGFGGAALMAAEACARMGSGLTSLATAPENIVAATVRCPEIMAAPVRTGVEVEHLLDNASVIAVGPGLGQEPWSEQLLYSAITSNKPLVIDADGLNLLAKGVGEVALMAANADRTLVLTPHPGEACRLLGSSSQAVQTDRLTAATGLAEKYSAFVVLKGAGTIVVSPSGDIFVCHAGNPGMASGGMGDVLTGLITGLLAQGLVPDLAVNLAVMLHACAADQLAQAEGARGLLATDVIAVARALLNGVASVG